MFLETGHASPGGTAILVQLPEADTNNNTTGICYAGLRFDSDGNVYEMSATGNWFPTGAWLLSGAAADYYLWRTVDLGTLSNDDGDGNQLNTDDLDFWISNSVTWFDRTTTVTFSISDDSAGSNILVSKQYIFVAYSEGTGSPP